MAQSGWPHFRDLESALAIELGGRDHLVIDTGGGIIERAENIAALRRTACVVWLRASADAIVRRIEGGTRRPALTAGRTFTEEVAEVLARRTPLYAGACHFQVDTDRLTPAQVADRVVEIWNAWQGSGGAAPPPDPAPQ